MEWVSSAHRSLDLLRHIRVLGTMENLTAILTMRLPRMAVSVVRIHASQTLT